MNRKVHFHCVIIGDGPDRDLLLRDIRKKKLTRHITYLGHQHNTKVAEYLDAADIFFLPSLYEGIALSIYEAMAKELPIVGANTGGQSELVTADCGFLIETNIQANEAAQYAHCLEKLIKNPSLAIFMGMNGRKRVETFFEYRDMVKSMDKLLTDPGAGGASTMPDITTPYIVLLNSLLHRETSYKELQKNAHVIRVVQKYTRQFQLARKVYRTFKQIVVKILFAL